MNHRFALSMAMLVVGLTAGSASAQIDLLSGKRLKQPNSQPFSAGSDSPKVTASGVILAAKGKQPAQLSITAQMTPGWHIYSITQAPGGPVKTKLKLDPSSEYRITGEFKPDPAPEKHSSDVWPKLTVEEHSGRVTWRAPIEFAQGVDPARVEIRGSVYAQACATSCLMAQDHKFTAKLGAEPAPKARESAASAAAGTYTIEDEGSETAGLPLMILFSLIGGLILNLMPCVLPVIGLKVLAFVEQSGQSRGRVVLLNMWYSAGMLLVFMVLATLAVTLNLGWGQQFSSTTFNIVMASVVFAMALSFLGFWEIPIPGFVGSGAAVNVAAREGAIGAFAKGMLTTVLATPCSGPFLGSVFGFTLKQPPYVTYVIFGSIGVGMASPYLLIGAAFPRLIRLLPKPGAWMETFKQLMAFMLLGTVVFMFSFMDRDYLVPTFALLIGIWAACWWIGRTPYTYSFQRKALVWLEGAAVMAIVGSFAFTWLVPRESLLEWRPFSRQRLSQLTSEGKTVMIDFTAEWCPNCKLNMLTAINTNGVREIVRANGVVPMLADWTEESPEIKQMLASLDSRSIPVLAIFPADHPRQPIVLRDVITQHQLIEALKKAGPSQVQTARIDRHSDASSTVSAVAAESDLSRN